MIRLKCPGGTIYRRGEAPWPCTYEVDLKDPNALAEALEAKRKFGGYTCPACGRLFLKVQQRKEEGPLNI